MASTRLYLAAAGRPSADLLWKEKWEEVKKK